MTPPINNLRVAARYSTTLEVCALSQAHNLYKAKNPLLYTIENYCKNSTVLSKGTLSTFLTVPNTINDTRTFEGGDIVEIN